MTMPGRSGELETTAYRYGYQGSEKNIESDNGGGNQYTTEFRQLDARFGRWFSIDPVFQPHQSPYNSMDGDPINFNDPKGDNPPWKCDDCDEEKAGFDEVRSDIFWAGQGENTEKKFKEAKENYALGGQTLG